MRLTLVERNISSMNTTLTSYSNDKIDVQILVEVSELYQAIYEF